MCSLMLQLASSIQQLHLLEAGTHALFCTLLLHVLYAMIYDVTGCHRTDDQGTWPTADWQGYQS
jgi:hypothetical protein